MEINSIQFLILFVLAVLSTGIITPLMRRVANHIGVVDQPNQAHKTHREPIPYLGGVGIMITVLVILVSGSLLLNIDSNTQKIVLTIIVPSVLIGLVGLADDIQNLSLISRLIAQSIAALFTSIVIISTDTVGSPTGNSYLDFAITVVWIVGITNAINFFDNHDGGASGTVAISSFMLFILAASTGQFYIAALAIVLSGSCFGFLYWNRNPARIYMGDAGSLFLGMIFAIILIRFDPNSTNRWIGYGIPVLLLALPILDTAIVVFSRIQRRILPWRAGQDHLSHRLLRRGFSRRRTAVFLWSGTGIFSLLVLCLSSTSQSLQSIIFALSTFLWLGLFFWFFRQNPYV
jgi:UDP-GlcNAc:undecaprenyl-phosphate GlcNAc-1-phosphate transferase